MLLKEHFWDPLYNDRSLRIIKIMEDKLKMKPVSVFNKNTMWVITVYLVMAFTPFYDQINLLVKRIVI